MTRRRWLLSVATASGLAHLLPASARAQQTAEVLEVDAQEELLVAAALKPWKGDLDGIVERGMVRVAMPFGIATYFLDGVDQKGPYYDLAVEFEKDLKARLGKSGERLTMVLLPAGRDRLFSMVADGLADVAAGNLTVTPERQKLVSFSVPFRSDVREVMVTGPAAPVIEKPADILRTTIHVRRSSSFFEHLEALNARRVSRGDAPFPVVEVDENLQIEDLVQMVDVGLIPATIADSPVAEFLTEIFDNITVRADMELARDQSLAWAVRPDARKLLEALDGFMSKAAKGTKTGNILLAKYIKNIDWAHNALAADDRDRLAKVIDHLKKYSSLYDFDWLMIGAQAYQESGLDQSKRSRVGAIGIMQVMPTTARDPNVGIPDIHVAERNVEAGVKYLRFVRDRYFTDPDINPIDQTLFSFAAYNAGPGNINKARQRATKMGLSPNIWFNNVEVAAGKIISREPVVYVRNVYKYYVAYKLIAS